MLLGITGRCRPARAVSAIAPARPHSRRTLQAEAGASPLVTKRCTPCEEDGGALEKMGLCVALSRPEAEALLQQVEGWRVDEDAQGHLCLRRSWRTKNFKRALELCQRIGTVAEAEGHHPDLHLTGWNGLEVVLQTHARSGLTENDFIMAAKIDGIDKSDLLSKKKSFADI